MKIQYTYKKSHLEKIGNTIIFLTERIEDLAITKLLKLLYILDEESVKETGNPFLNLDYEVWQFGPVDANIYLSLVNNFSLLNNYVVKREENDTFISIKEFSKGEFCEYEIELLEKVVRHFGQFTVKDLVKYTHRKGSLWNQIAEENGILKGLENEEIPSTNLKIDLSRLIENDEFKKSIFNEYKLYN
jgi:uncharacterized phage-associated protein